MYNSLRFYVEHLSGSLGLFIIIDYWRSKYKVDEENNENDFVSVIGTLQK